MKEFILWLILSILLLTSTCNTLNLYENQLDIAQGLIPFQNCIIHVVYLHRTEFYDSAAYGSYELMPFHFPVMLTQFNFKKIWTPYTFVNPKHCSLHSWFAGKGRNYYWAPQQRISTECTAVVLIDSPLCFGLNSEKEQPDLFTYALSNTVQRHRDVSSLTALKPRMFVIHVGKDNSGSAIDQLVKMVASKYMPVTFIGFLVKTVKSVESNIVVSGIKNTAYIQVCPDTINYMETFKRQCFKKYDSLLSLFEMSMCQQKLQNFMEPEYMPYSIDSIPTWKELEMYEYSACKDRILIQEVIENLEDLPNGGIEKNGYVLNWSKNVDVLPFILVRVFLGNATFLFNEDKGFNQNDGLVGTLHNSMKVVPVWSGKIKSEQSFDVPSELSFTGAAIDQIHFVMCSRLTETEGMSFKGFFSAFKWQVWLTLLLFILGGGFFVQLMNQQFASVPKSSGLTEIGSNFLCVYSVLLVQGSSLVNKNRIYYGTWMLAGLVISNEYLGDNIDKLTAPIKVSRLDTFEKILENNISIYSPPSASDGMQYKGLVGFLDNTWRIFSNGTSSPEYWNSIASLTKLMPGKENFSKEFKVLVEGQMKAQTDAGFETVFGSLYKTKHWNVTNQEIDRRLLHIQPGRSVVDFFDSAQQGYFIMALSKCFREAYVDTWSNVLSVKLHLLEKVVNKSMSADIDDIVVSKFKYGHRHHTFQLVNVKMPPHIVLVRFHSLMQSGIDAFWHEWKGRIDAWNDTVKIARQMHSNNEFKPATISGNIKVIFIALVFLVCGAFISFCVEVLTSVSMKVVQIASRLPNHRALFRTQDSGRKDAGGKVIAITKVHMKKIILNPVNAST